MRLKYLEINGFKSFAKKTTLAFEHSVAGIVGPNGSGKSNVVEAFRFVLGEQSMKSMRGKAGTDLIFKGSKALSQGSKASVSIHLDNSDKIFKVTNEQGELVNLNFDTVTIAREVYADGINKYLLNGSEVRLKDINNLLASVHIGASGHHIISQGEADRILNSSSRDRREMIEEALGLKIFQYKIKETERKLERTRENIKEVGLLRRENAPHLNFLKKQVEKFELAKGMRIELLDLYKDFFRKESFYLREEGKILKEEKTRLSKELEHIEHTLSLSTQTEEKGENPLKKEISVLENKIYELRRLKNELERKSGRIEAMIEIEEKKSDQEKNTVLLSQDELRSVLSDLNKEIDVAISKEDLKEVKTILFNIKEILNKFGKRGEGKTVQDFSVLNGLKDSQGKVSLEIDKIGAEEERFRNEVKELENKIELESREVLHKEREKFELKSKKQALLSSLEINKVKEENIFRATEALDTEKHEAVAIVGHQVLYYEDNSAISVDRVLQEELKKKIERIKIKLEDAGATLGSDVLKEYEDMEERDKFLARELEDLKKSIESLEKIITDLKEKVEVEFKEGIKKINIEFEEFFRLMFGGGRASLALILESKKKKGEEDSAGEDIAFEQGIEIDVSLPHKKVKELHALSGGERSLTSIALLFAMSQVNPPPFLILDETDAALDEANSRKYGDMLEKLSKHSQLIVVTHNRETMSRAGIIYGVTIGADGASKLLSIRFEEAQAIAK